MNMPNGSILLLSDALGIYQPKAFFERFKDVMPESITNVSKENREVCLSGPENEWYWDSWDAVCASAVVTDHSTGQRYTVYQDGDTWLIPEGAEWNEEELS